MDDLNHPLASTTIMLPFGEFADDLEHNLGRANGNCYQRRPGIPNVHDGQIMVRLKKKRFIVIDYSIVPTPIDLAYAAVTPHVKTPPGAGIQKCTTVNCPKIGVPVCLFGAYRIMCSCPSHCSFCVYLYVCMCVCEYVDGCIDI
jgi:hypothetical protein